MLGINAFAYLEQEAHAAPGGTAGTWVNDTNVRNMTASSKPVYANMVSFYYKPNTLKSLPSTFASNSNRTYKMYVMEDDVGNYDDYVKYYTGVFSGRYLSSISYDSTVATGSIEDLRGIELYIRQQVGTVSGDNSTSYTTLFSFYFGVD